ncbi:hypothetical protein Godav_014302 [Gossypium davidsonii]|uniref:Uncharacterized protein n=2 Tax=Gossypium TaxID=3633 RepID=A0A7J8RJN8_GOSDV|nr:hypothetical protein [Gossypium davidsonii]MBA0649142.1 hypothetical protein [Gossypium klotzschianum]
MLTMTYLKRIRNKMREMMFTLMETVKKEKHLRYLLHILKLEGRNPQSKLEGLEDCPVKLKNYAM